MDVPSAVLNEARALVNAKIVSFATALTISVGGDGLVQPCTSHGLDELLGASVVKELLKEILAVLIGESVAQLGLTRDWLGKVVGGDGHCGEERFDGEHLGVWAWCGSASALDAC